MSSITSTRRCRSIGCPDLHDHIREELRVTADGYAAFTREYLARRVG